MFNQRRKSLKSGICEGTNLNLKNEYFFAFIFIPLIVIEFEVKLNEVAWVNKIDKSITNITLILHKRIIYIKITRKV